MKCPFCGSNVRTTTRHLELSGNFPLVERYYVCKAPPNEFGHCGWSGKTREEYIGTLTQSNYGKIDVKGNIIKFIPQIPMQ